jgi:hypothetical protein
MTTAKATCEHARATARLAAAADEALLAELPAKLAAIDAEERIELEKPT